MEEEQEVQDRDVEEERQVQDRGVEEEWEVQDRGVEEEREVQDRGVEEERQVQDRDGQVGTDRMKYNIILSIHGEDKHSCIEKETQVVHITLLILAFYLLEGGNCRKGQGH